MSGGVDYASIQQPGTRIVMFPARMRRELAIIIYESNIFGTQPRSFEVIFLKPEFASTELSISKLYYSGDHSQLIILKNKSPVWNSRLFF